MGIHQNSQSSIRTRLRQRSWRRDDGKFFISTDHTQLDPDAINEWLGSPEIYWAKSLPLQALLETLENSLCFGLYSNRNQTDEQGRAGQADESSTDSVSGPSTRMIGFARCITDFTTFLFLTDVHIIPECQGLGLGKWLVQCVQQVIRDMPYLRRSMLFTSDWDRSVPFYERLMDMQVIRSGDRNHGPAILQFRGPGMPDTL